MSYKKSLIFCFLIFCISNIFSQSKTIRNLQFDFKQTTKSENKQETNISGNFYFQNNPYRFVYNITYPKKQTSYINADGCFYKDETGSHNFNEGLFFVNQTCVDYLTWFKNDFGLHDSGFIISNNIIEKNHLISLWKYNGYNITNEVQTVKTFINEKNETYKIQTFDQEDNIISEINLTDYYKKTGFVFPGKITTTWYNNKNISNTTTLEFSNVKFNQLEEKFPEYKASKIIISPSHEKTEIKNNKIVSEKIADPKYNVSISSVLVNVAYNGYKTFVTKQDNSSCPFEPSCSKYMKDAVSQHGLFGIIEGLERLRRCTAEEHSTNKYIKNQNGKHLDPVSR